MERILKKNRWIYVCLTGESLLNVRLLLNIIVYIVLPNTIYTKYIVPISNTTKSYRMSLFSCFMY